MTGSLFSPFLILAREYFRKELLLFAFLLYLLLCSIFAQIIILTKRKNYLLWSCDCALTSVTCAQMREFGHILIAEGARLSFAFHRAPYARVTLKLERNFLDIWNFAFCGYSVSGSVSGHKNSRMNSTVTIT